MRVGVPVWGDRDGPGGDRSRILDPQALDPLLEALRRRGFTPIGPTVRQGAICYDEIESAADLPAGWTDEQDGAATASAAATAIFNHNVGPNSWKSHLFPASLKLWKAQRNGNGLQVEEEPAGQGAPYAFIGVRSCDMHAIAVQDKTFVEGPWADPDYKARREGAFIVTVNCAKAGGTCFCVSMETGPKATFGFDLSLTELLDDHGHRFLVEVGSERGGGAPGGGHAAVRGRRRAGGGSCARRDRGEHGPLARHDGHKGPALPQPRASALGRSGRLLPDLRQLHPRLPDLLLQQRRGRDRPRRRGGHPRAQVGVVLLRSSTPTCTAAACAARARLAIASG